MHTYQLPSYALTVNLSCPEKILIYPITILHVTPDELPIWVHEQYNLLIDEGNVEKAITG